jgi:hypothetical protein
MSKPTIAREYFETLAQARKCRPRSKRKAILLNRLVNLVVRQLRKETRSAA